MKIAVAGLGYVGLSLAVLLAQHKKLFVFHHLGRTAQHIDHRKPLVAE